MMLKRGSNANILNKNISFIIQETGLIQVVNHESLYLFVYNMQSAETQDFLKSKIKHV